MMENIALDQDSLDGPASLLAPPAISQVGDYRVVREVGRGGMGVVYEAEQMSLGRVVALKLLPTQGAASGRQKERFLREARAAAKLHHTNIVPVFEFGEADGILYYAMQFICGQGVDAVIEELRAQAGGGNVKSDGAAELVRSLASGTFEPTEDSLRAGSGSTHSGTSTARSSFNGDSARADRGALQQGIARLGLQVANALKYAHQQGVLHRDVKPSNLLLDIHGTAWVTDFGLAKTEGLPDLTRDGDVLGTLRYLPPEALDAKGDSRGDVYSLGLTLYELLALRPAFDAPDRASLVRQIAMANPTPLRKLLPSLPRDLTTIVHKAIQKEPGRRYRSAASLADDLQRFLDNRPIAARPVSAVGHAWRACKRNPVASGMAAAALLALLAAASGLWWGREAGLGGEKAANDAADALRIERDEVTRLNASALDRLYVADLNRAQLNWYGGNVSLVRDLLAAHRPPPGGTDRRGIEWHYLYRLANGSSRVIPSANRRMPALRISPNGDRIASAGGGGLDVWTAAGEWLWSYKPEKEMEYFYDAAFSATGDRLVYTENVLTISPQKTGRHASKLQVFDAATGRLLKSVPTGTEVRAVAFSPNQNVVVAACGDGKVRVWNSESWVEGEPLRGHPLLAHAADFTPNGAFLATAGGDKPHTVRVWDTSQQSWKTTHTINEGGADGLSLSPDGRQVIVPGGDDVRAWDVSAETPRFAWRRVCGAIRAKHHPDGSRILVACNDSAIRILDSATGAEIGTLRGHENAVEALATNRDGSMIASAGRDRSIRIWNIDRAAEARTLPSRYHRVLSADYSRDGTILATAGAQIGNAPGAVWAWEAATGKPIGLLGTHKSDAQRVRFSPDGQWLLSSGRDGFLKCWKAVDLPSEPVWSVFAHPGWLGTTDINFHPDGKHFVSSGWDFTLRVNEIATGKLVVSIRTPGRANWNACYRADGKRIAAACDIHGIDTHPSVIVYDTETGREVFRLADSEVSHSVPRFSPDGKILYAASQGVTVRTWNAETGQPLAIAFKGHTGWVQSIAISPDGKRMLTASRDGTARIWDAATGHELLAFRGHVGIVREATFHPNGLSVVTTGDDGTTRIWDSPRE